MAIFSTLRTRLRYLPIGRMLFGGFGLTLVLAGLIGALSLAAISRVDAEASALANKWLKQYSDLTTLRTEIREVRETEIKFSQSENGKRREKYAATMDKQMAAIDAALASLQAAAADDDERAKTKALVDAWAGYADFQKRIVALGRDDKLAEAAEMSDFGGKTAYDKNHEALLQMLAFVQAGGQAAGERADKVTKAAAHTVQVLLVVTLLVGVGLAWAITRRTVSQLGGEPRAAVLLARAVADGDLTTKVATAGIDAGSLMARLDAMQTGLSRTVADVRRAAEGVATASSEIAQGNLDLSQRTEQQASALQQTAATMDQLGTTVRHNADSARQANQLAQGASTVAREGGDVVQRVVQTMKGIDDSSRKIADIISVIDAIAFQTNILALNAAVEAARAGEQGRGFAVVAGEVRALAQRSAEAAKQIKQLIDDSVGRVDQGNALVDEAGRKMQEIVGAIQRVTDIVGEISAASAEQSTGVAQVGQAIAQLDEATQRNAALVEESAAAADSMRQQAAQLVQSVAVFRIAESAATPAPASTHQPGTPAQLAAAATSKAAHSAGVSVRALAPTAAPKAPVISPAPTAPRAAPQAARAAGDGDWETF